MKPVGELKAPAGKNTRHLFNNRIWTGINFQVNCDPKSYDEKIVLIYGLEDTQFSSSLFRALSEMKEDSLFIAVSRRKTWDVYKIDRFEFSPDGQHIVLRGKLANWDL